jgi:hypothetical protein
MITATRCTGPACHARYDSKVALLPYYGSKATLLRFGAGGRGRGAGPPQRARDTARPAWRPENRQPPRNVPSRER